MESRVERRRSGPVHAGFRLNDAELARLAVSTAVDGVAALEQVGLEPSDKLRARAEGDPVEIAAFVERHKRLQAETNAA